MNILFAASEAAPFVKTGGLADVAGSLPKALADAGHTVKVILPLYESMCPAWRDQMTFLKYFYVNLSWRTPYCGVFELEKDGVTYWFLDNEYYFRRSQIYGHYDDGERFGFFSKAILETPCQLDWYPDVIHCNDWQTALVPIYLMEERWRHPQLENTRTLFTIHNIEYQGRYGKQTMQDLFGLDNSYFNGKMLEFHDDVNLMKGAIYASDWVNTVSPTYAQELNYSFYAHGLEGVVQDCASKISGILNGIDVDLYNPAKDDKLAKKFTAKSLAGKKACKEALQKEVGLNVDPNVPIIACVSRLVSHKGFDLVNAVLHDIMRMEVQMVVLGTGDWAFEESFRQAAGQYPGRFSAQIMYSAQLSSLIYAGADLFLMPSIAEPCGLSQMIAMRYGTLPVVRETGGLKDSVPPYNYVTGEGTGFTFADVNAHDMLHVLESAVGLYYDYPKEFKKLQKNAMTADFSWDASAKAYEEIYQRLTGE